jgi:GMP synthase-like glutamine amidotransferase
MRIHYLQHVPFEDLGALADLFSSRGHEISCTHLYKPESLPPLDDFDALVIMGGPMGVYDDDRYPWLAAEKRFIREVIDSTCKPVLGICLGAQLIAHSLGATVSRNQHREIGWFPLQLAPELQQSSWASISNEPTIMAFHWHGDTFSIPPEAIPIGSTEACPNQGFIINDRIVALQFHLETTFDSASALISHCGDELDDTTYVQSALHILAQSDNFAAIHGTMKRLISQWLRR